MAEAEDDVEVVFGLEEEEEEVKGAGVVDEIGVPGMEEGAEEEEERADSEAGGTKVAEVEGTALAPSVPESDLGRLGCSASFIMSKPADFPSELPDLWCRILSFSNTRITPE